MKSNYSYVDEAYKEIERGLAGDNFGIPTSSKLFNRVAGNVQRGTYYLVGGDTGSGKSALVTQWFVIDVIDSVISMRLPVIPVCDMFSLEMKDKVNVLRWLPNLIFKHHGIVIPYRKIVGKGESKLSPKEKEIIDSMKSRLREIEKHVFIYDRSLSPDTIMDISKSRLSTMGQFREVKLMHNGMMQTLNKFFPSNSQLWYFVIVDHGARVTGNETKKKMDRMSDHLVELRNMADVTPIMIQQFSRNLSSTDRTRFKQLEPKLSDFKDTGNSQHDADVVLALANPQFHGLESYRNYQIFPTEKGKKDGLRNSFRGLHFLKDRFGTPDIFIPLHYLGAAYYFSDLPRVEWNGRNPLPPSQQPYMKYTNPEYLHAVISGKDPEPTLFNQ
jgi:replicative DNA helicase